jgi:hypothetical protein
MGGIDVGFTEAVVGAGVTGIIFIVALIPDNLTDKRLKYSKYFILFAFAGLLIYGSLDLARPRVILTVSCTEMKVSQILSLQEVTLYQEAYNDARYA